MKKLFIYGKELGWPSEPGERCERSVEETL